MIENVPEFTLLGGTIAVWIQTVVFGISALIAIATIQSNESQARRRATIDFVLHEMRDETYRKHRLVFVKLRGNSKSITALACKDFSVLDDEQKCQIQAIQFILNHYEFIATGIHEHALDAEIYKKMKKTVTIKDYEDLHVFIVQLRQNNSNPLIYEQIEKLVGIWKAEKPKKKWLFF